MTAIVRSETEVDAAAMRAQAAAFVAEDADETDEPASAIYAFWQWMTGNADADPTAEMGEAQ